MSAPGAPDRHPRDRLARGLSLNDATMLVVSSVIGSGIFLTPGPVAGLLPHPGLILAAWVAVAVAQNEPDRKRMVEHQLGADHFVAGGSSR